MNVHRLLTTQHADYEADLENPHAGLDTCPIDLDTHPFDCDDLLDTRPCNACGHTTCGCIDSDSPFAHHTVRRGW